MGTLFIVATPIGNLEDITLRALRILKEVDLIVAENPKITKILLAKYKIKTSITSYHQHTSQSKTKQLVLKLKKGKNLALVSSAGTPAILDPGIRLIKAVLEAKIKVVSIPGPSALIVAASISGINMSHFLFLGFLPTKKGRKKILSLCRDFSYPIIFYESPHRIFKTLRQIKEILGEKKIVILRELTKKFEERLEGKISEIQNKIKPKGEFVVIICPKD